MEVRPVVFRVHAAHQVGVGCEIQACVMWTKDCCETYSRTQARGYSDFDLDFLSLSPDLPRTSLDSAVRLSLSRRSCLQYSNLVQ
jgi:hypothetical protein